MAKQVIIEFIGDTAKPEDAYNKLNSQITDSANLNKESAAHFKKLRQILFGYMQAIKAVF